MENPRHIRHVLISVTRCERALAAPAKELWLGDIVERRKVIGGVATTELDFSRHVDGSGGVHGPAGEHRDVVFCLAGGGVVVGEAFEGLGSEAAPLEEKVEF